MSDKKNPNSSSNNNKGDKREAPKNYNDTNKGFEPNKPMVSRPVKPSSGDKKK